ncbi:MAG: DUF4383 domain-containing protein [Chloroflexota bacterium]
MGTGQKVGLVLGIVYLAVGILGFIPALVVPSTQPGQGLLLGIFAVNVVHNVVHIGAGAVLIWASLSATRIALVGRVLAIVFAVLVVASFVAPIAEGVAINLPDTLLHLVSAAVTGWVAFVASSSARRPLPA